MAVASLRSRVFEIAGDGVRQVPPSSLGDVAAAVTSFAAIAAQHGEYYRLTARSMALLQEHGFVAHGDAIWGFVRSSGRIAANLDMRPVGLTPQQALSLQALAVSLALRTAIKQVEDAVKRVEEKVDDVLALLRADRVGDIVGTLRVLEPLVDRTHESGEVSRADWQAVATLGPALMRDIEALRSHIRSTLATVGDGWIPGPRARVAGRLFDHRGLLIESIALLVVAEECLSAWHEIRIAHVRSDEPVHLQWTVKGSAASLKFNAAADQEIADTLRQTADRLTTPKPQDGLAVWLRDDFESARSTLTDLVTWFADQRSLDLERLDNARYPTARESIRHLGGAIRTVGGRPARAVRALVQRRTDGPGASELPPPKPE